jgi:hypothetical protein
LDLVKYLVDECGADVHAETSDRKTAFDLACRRKRHTIVAFLLPCLKPKPKMYALCMGLHRRLGTNSPLQLLNVDVMQEIAKHIIRWKPIECPDVKMDS